MFLLMAAGSPIAHRSPGSGKSTSLPSRTFAISARSRITEVLQTGILTNLLNDQYAVTADGKKFLIPEPSRQGEASMMVVVNWDAGLARR